MPDSGRNATIDALRCIAILRVIAMHTLSRLHGAPRALLSFVFPGMPIVFAVSGALAFSALSSGSAAARVRFWRSRARRLLWPYWTYAACVVLLLLVADGTAMNRWHAFDRSEIVHFLVPLRTPVGSVAFQHLATHLWFMAPFLVLLATAPLTVALHRKAPWSGAIAFATASVAASAFAPQLPSWIQHVLVFGIAFQAGFGITDGRLPSLPRTRLLAGTAALAAAGVTLHHSLRSGAILNEVPLAHVLVGLAWLGLWLAVREPIERAIRRAAPAAACRVVNRRAYTLFLWGPAANDVAMRVALHVPEGVCTYTYVASTAAALVAFAWLLGRVEDRAAGRARSRAAVGGVANVPSR